MGVLLVAPALRHQTPAIVFEQTNELAERHFDHGADALGWAMSRKAARQMQRNAITPDRLCKAEKLVHTVPSG